MRSRSLRGLRKSSQTVVQMNTDCTAKTWVVFLGWLQRLNAEARRAAEKRRESENHRWTHMNTDSAGRTTRVKITPSPASNSCVLCALCGWRSPLCESLRSSASLRFNSYLRLSVSICGCISTKKEAALADGFCEVSPRLLVATAESHQRRQTQTCQRERRRLRNQIQVEALHANQVRRSCRPT